MWQTSNNVLHHQQLAVCGPGAIPSPLSLHFPFIFVPCPRSYLAYTTLISTFYYYYYYYYYYYFPTFYSIF